MLKEKGTAMEIHAHKYAANKYSGGTWCGNGLFSTIDECLEFARDGFCDYVRVFDEEEKITYKIHFDGQ